MKREKIIEILSSQGWSWAILEDGRDSQMLMIKYYEVDTPLEDIVIEDSAMLIEYTHTALIRFRDETPYRFIFSERTVKLCRWGNGWRDEEGRVFPDSSLRCMNVELVLDTVREI